MIRQGLKKYRNEGIYSFLRSTFKYLKSLNVIIYIWSIFIFNMQSINGVQIDVGSDEISPKIKLEIASGEYESEEVDQINKYVNKNMNVVGIGGGIGYTACVIDNILDKNQDHIVIEPNEELLPIIHKNRTINKCEFEVLNLAYSPQCQMVEFTIPKDFWGGSLYRNEGNKQTVRSINIKSLIRGKNINKFCLVIDAEGIEEALISNEIAILEKCCELLIVEYHDEKESYDAISKDILNAKKIMEESDFSLVEQNGEVWTYVNQSI